MRFQARLVALGLIVVSCWAGAQHPEIEFELQPGEHVVLAPGESKFVTWRINNLTPLAMKPFDVDVRSGSWRPSPFGYNFDSQNSEVCGQLEEIPRGAKRNFRFPIKEEIPAGEAVSCLFKVTRSVDSTRDLYLVIGEEIQYFGYLPDFDLRSEITTPPRFGDAGAIVRLFFDNPSDFRVLADAGGCRLTERPYSIVELDRARACEVLRSGPTCFSGSFGIRIGEAAPKGSKSCLLGIRFDEPLSDPILFRIGLIGVGRQGISFLDADPSNNGASLSLTPSARPVAVPVLSWWTLLVLLSAFLAAARRRLGTGDENRSTEFPN